MSHSLEKARALVRKHRLGGILTLSPVPLRYLTGLCMSRGTLLITPTKASLFIDRRYAFAAVSLSPEFEVIVSSTAIEEQAALKERLLVLQGAVGFDPSTTTVEQFQTLVSLGGHLEPASALFSELRRPKSPDEIATIKAACILCAQGFHFLLHQLREGVTEEQLVQALKAFWFTNGAESLSFDPIIAFGPNSACPHWIPSAFALTKGSPVLIDIGVSVHGYNSDMTRTLFFGRPDPELIACKDVVLEAYRRAEARAVPGVTPLQLDAVAREYITSEGYGEYFVHGLGHGVGLQVHEPPRISAAAPDESALQVGDVITIEPGIYLPGRGGVRVENTVVIEEAGARSLIPLPLEVEL
jgi:Xaa-Pro aminopeptidase